MGVRRGLYRADRMGEAFSRQSGGDRVARIIIMLEWRERWSGFPTLASLGTLWSLDGDAGMLVLRARISSLCWRLWISELVGRFSEDTGERPWSNGVVLSWKAALRECDTMSHTAKRNANA